MSSIIDYMYNVASSIVDYICKVTSIHPVYLGLFLGLLIAVVFELALNFRHGKKEVKQTVSDKSKISVVDYAVSSDLENDIEHVIELLDASARAEYRAFDILSSHEGERPPNDKMLAVAAKIDALDKTLLDTKKAISKMFIRVVEK